MRLGLAESLHDLRAGAVAVAKGLEASGGSSASWQAHPALSSTACCPVPRESEQAGQPAVRQSQGCASTGQATHLCTLLSPTWL